MTIRRLILLLLLPLCGCTSIPMAEPERPHAPPVSGHAASSPLEASAFRESPEPITVEDHWILHLYTWFHARDYRASRLDFPGSDGEPAVAHLLLPPGRGPHPAVLVFPILAGSHVVSEGLAKALVRRGFAVLRVERRAIFPEDETTADPRVPAERLRHAIIDGLRLIDWLATDARIDPDRLGTAGVSLGGIMAATLMGLDARIRSGFFVMAGGGLAEILYDSRERPVRAFRDRVLETLPRPSREAFLEALRPHTLPLDPLTHAAQVDPRHVLLVSGRFDRVVPPERTEALWEGFGRPTWRRFPAGHYQLFPFFWWAAARGAEHLQRTGLGSGGGPTHVAVGVDEETQVLE